MKFAELLRFGRWLKRQEYTREERQTLLRNFLNDREK